MHIEIDTELQGAKKLTLNEKTDKLIEFLIRYTEYLEYRLTHLDEKSFTPAALKKIKDEIRKEIKDG